MKRLSVPNSVYGGSKRIKFSKLLFKDSDYAEALKFDLYTFDIDSCIMNIHLRYGF